jgi:hypothetical protein
MFVRRRQDFLAALFAGDFLAVAFFDVDLA